MSKILRQSIVPIAAIIGVQGSNLVLSSAPPAQSSGCLQWANDAIDAAREALPQAEPQRTAEDGYYDVRQKKDVDLPSAPAATTSYDPAAVPSAVGTQAVTAAASTSSVLPVGMTEAQYQQQRLALGGY